MYYFFFNKFLNHLYEKGIKRRKMLDYRAFLEKSQWWTPEELRRHQGEALAQFLLHAYQNVPYWQETFRRLGLTPADIKSPEDLKKLPIIDKADIRAHKEQMIADNWRGKT